METWYVLAVDTAHQFKSKQDGNLIRGVRFLLQDPAAEVGDRTRFRGFVWQEQFVSNERLAKLNVQPMPGDTITITFNRYGDIAEIKVI